MSAMHVLLLSGLIAAAEGSGCDGEISPVGKGDVNKPFEQLIDTALPPYSDYIKCACSSFPRTLYMEYTEEWHSISVPGVSSEFSTLVGCIWSTWKIVCWSVGVVLVVLLACCGIASLS